MQLKFIVFSLLILGLSISLDAQKTRDGGRKKMPAGKNVEIFMKRTNGMIAGTHALVKKQKKYTGFLHKSKQLQKEAIVKFEDKQFDKALKKSYIARRYAFLAYKENGEQVPKAWRLNEHEIRMIHRHFPVLPTDEELKEKINEDDKTSESVDEEGDNEDADKHGKSESK